jgi:hypothetical protein
VSGHVARSRRRLAALVACAALLAPSAASGATEVIGELGRPGTECKTVGEDGIFLQAYFAGTTRVGVRLG